MNRIIFALLTIFILQFGAFSALAAQQINLDNEGRALHGYDPVSYFSGEPKKGSKEISYEYQKGRYLFASNENREAFIASPEKYRIAYGGYCAWAMLEGEKVDVDPERFKTIDGVVYLFYNTFFTDTLKKWNKLAGNEPEQELIDRANGWWMKINMQ